ncbi:tripartite tricarboxylate transporter TctB family protein, partial [Salmonella enterica subsp. enterica serovar Anatum]|nr:tripartite tricarboxylate transporter TctB family protein [Salmonella enterica subsp. enterica serovar Anatum]
MSPFATYTLTNQSAPIRLGWQIQSEYSYEPVGPRPFPLGIIGLMALCALALLLRHPDTVSW